ncbi:MAG: serine protease [Phycisphaeraceae bacterium]
MNQNPFMNRRLMPGIVLLSLLWALPASADDQRRVIESGKAATALVELPSEGGFGSAFCIDARGLFITNAHVVAGLAERETLTMVLYPGERRQRKLRARVLARDDESDLALLRMTGAEGLTALPLGGSDELFETMQVTAFGYPFGDMLTLEEETYPSVTVNVARISAIRRADGAPQLIQLDSQLNPGNSGGPVIDEAGHVVGIVVAGVPGAGINFAIPVGTLKTLMAEPRIVVDLPEIAFDDRTEAVTMSIHVISFASDQSRPVVKVVLGEDETEQRTFRAQSTDGNGSYEARIVPVAPGRGSTQVPVTIEYDSGSTRTSVLDRALRLDDQEFQLSEISRIEFVEDAVVVVNQAGVETRGDRLAMAPLVVTLAGQPVRVNQQALNRLLIHEPEVDTRGIAFTIQAEVEGNVMAEHTGTLEFTGLPALADGAGPDGAGPVAGVVPPLPPTADTDPLLVLEEVAQYEAPGNLVEMIVNEERNRLFVKNAGSRVWVIDLANGQVISEQAPQIAFSDMSLTADGGFLYASDFGGERVGHGEPKQPHHVHRYTVANNRWEMRGVSSIAHKIAAVAPTRFVLHSEDQWLTMTLNQWDARGVGITELDRKRWGSRGGLVYDPRTQRLIHGNSGSSSREVMAMRVQGDQLIQAESSGTYGAAQEGGGTYVLSADGKNFFYGPLMFGTLDMTRAVRTFPEPIVGAGTHLAFDQKGAYYEIRTGAKMGQLPFETNVFAWTPDGRQMWCYDQSAHTIRRFRVLPEQP